MEIPYVKRHLEGLFEAITRDEFSDGVQYSSINFPHVPSVMRPMIDAFLSPLGHGLEVGPGTTPYQRQGGGPLPLLVEPSMVRVKQLEDLVRCFDPRPSVRQGVAENLSFLSDGDVAGVLMLNGFFQVRSDYEAILEFNRVLRIGGRLIFNIHTSDSIDVVVGRVYGARNLSRMVCQFGFRQMLLWEGEVGETSERYGGRDRQALLVFEKVRPAEYRHLNMPQLVPTADEGIYVARNFDFEGRERHLL